MRALALFARTELDTVLSAPDAEASAWAHAFGAARGIEARALDALAAPADGEPPEDVAARAWKACASAHGARVLAVLPLAALRLAVAAGLGFPPANAARLGVDPGRAVLLCRTSIGIVLRHANVLGPSDESGTALPGSMAPAAR